jgi:hypothetical protein
VRQRVNVVETDATALPSNRAHPPIRIILPLRGVGAAKRKLSVSLSGTLKRCVADLRFRHL